MSGTSYESGYDPKYGYNRHAFQEKTMATAILGRTVKIIATPLGLASEAFKSRKDRNPSRPAAPAKAEEKSPASSSNPSDSAPPPIVEVPAGAADRLIETGHAVPVEGSEPTHEIVPNDDSIERDETDWVLDDLVDETEPSPPLYGQAPHDQEGTVEDLIRSIPSVPKLKPSAPAQRLPFPVVIPQRRPGTKSRGLVRAYAPVLEDYNIPQDTFLVFLKSFHKAVQASPIFNVVTVAAAIAGVYPDPLIGLGILAVQVAASMGQEVQERYRANRFLDQANKDIFVPNGLFAMIVTYKPGDSNRPVIGTERVDMGAMAVAKYGDQLFDQEPSHGSPAQEDTFGALRRKAKDFRIASGATAGEAEMPLVCAPLIFPAVDAAAAATEAGGSEGAPENDFAAHVKTKSKNAQKFVQDYMDRRGQATFAINNPDAKLTTSAERPAFRSRLADPNDATNMHFFSLITGGRWKAEP
ncbi:MAG: hypothetical protein Q9174_003267 [Haloplaca sp. 1 TL-2023]